MKSGTKQIPKQIHLANFLMVGGILIGFISPTFAQAAEKLDAKSPPPVFATVGDTKITWLEYTNEYKSESSKKFYHGKPTQAELATFQREIGNKLVTDALLTQEAKRRNLAPDRAYVNQELSKYEQRFANDPKWPEARDRVLPLITTRLEGQNLREQLESLVRKIPAPSDKQLHNYYESHPDKFTSPPQIRVSIILLKVDPSASNDIWKKATELASDLVKRIRSGENFAEVARSYSGDRTAEAGGDMGYLHEGMLPGRPEEVISKLQPGEISDPVRLLEGVGIFRLTERTDSKTNSFEDSKQRASELWTSEQSDIAWNSLIEKLRKETNIQVNESLFLPLAAKPVKDKNPAIKK